MNLGGCGEFGGIQRVYLVESGRVEGYCDRKYGGMQRWVWSVEGKWGTADDYLGSDRGMKVCGLDMAEYVGDIQGKYAMGTYLGM